MKFRAALFVSLLASGQIGLILPPLVSAMPTGLEPDTLPLPSPAPAFAPPIPPKTAQPKTAQPEPASSAAAAAVAPRANQHPADLLSARDVVERAAATGWSVTLVSHGQRVKDNFVWNTQNSQALPERLTAQFADERPSLIEYGCTDILAKSFQRGMRNIDLTVYRFATPQGAFGAFTSMRKGATNVVTRGDRSSEDDQSISVLRGSYFIRIATTAADDDEAKENVTRIANEVVNSIGSSQGAPPLMSALPVIDRVNGSERLFMGPAAARRYTNFPYVGQLDLEKSTGAVYSDYQFAPPMSERMKLLIVQYPNYKSAVEVYERYVDTMTDVHNRITSTPNTALFKLSGSFLYCQMQGNTVAIVAGARKRVSPLMLARQINSSTPSN